MNDLIEALQIFAKYLEPDSYPAKCPTQCSHDMLTVNVTPEQVTDPADRDRLQVLGFFSASDEGRWSSFRFGSC